MKVKRIYIIKDFKNKQLERQLSWAEDEIKDISSFLFNKERLECRQYEVYNCKFLDQTSNKEYILKAVVMKSSSANEKNVVVCPIIDTRFNELLTQGFMIGRISALNDEKEYYARVSSLKSISKDAFKINDEDSLNTIKPIGHVNVNQFIAILTNYKKYMENIIQSNSEIDFGSNNYQIEYAC